MESSVVDSLGVFVVNWLDHGRTLREQGVEEFEMLLLRRKFFYSDQNVDSRDPVQLNLLYVQVKIIMASSKAYNEHKSVIGCDFVMPHGHLKCGFNHQAQLGYLHSWLYSHWVVAWY